MEIDPFTQTFDALWKMIDAHSPITKLVKKGNKIRFNQNEQFPLKDEIQDADIPEIILIPNGLSDVQLLGNSSSSSMTHQYQLLVSTGDLRVKYINQLTFNLVCACVTWKNYLGSLSWKDNKFVKRFDMNSSTQGQSDKEANRGIEGWSSIMDFEIEMWFTTNDLKAGAND